MLSRSRNGRFQSIRFGFFSSVLRLGFVVSSSEIPSIPLQNKSGYLRMQSKLEVEITVFALFSDFVTFDECTEEQHFGLVSFSDFWYR